MNEEESPDQRRAFRLDRETLVPLGSVATIVFFLVKVWLGLVEIETRQDAELKELRRNLNQRLTCQQRERFFWEFRQLNPDMKLPTLPGSCGGDE